MNRKLKNKIPEPIDFSTSAIKHAVALEINQHPFTIYPVLFTILIILYQLLFGYSPFLSGLATVFFFFALSSLVINKFFRKALFEKKYIERMRTRLHKNMELALLELHSELIKFNCNEGAQQIDAFKEKYESLVSVLQKKLDPAGIAYNRFLGMAEQVYKNGLDNLQQIVAFLDSISPVNADEINEKLEKLKSSASGDPETIDDISTLTNILKMREERIQTVNKLLHENIKAMARLDQTAMEISTIDESNKRASTQMEDAMNELLYLADQFRNFKAE